MGYGVCPTCKIEFKKKKKKQIFCGKSCANLGKNNPAYTGVKDKKRICKNCLNPFFMRTELEAKRKVFCKSNCKTEYHKRNGHPLSHNLFSKCITCGKEIKITKRKVGCRNFCGKLCSSKGNAIFIKGENNGRYFRGVSHMKRYPRIFIKMRALIRKRDGLKCALCRKNKDDLKRNLDVHHIDYDENNNNIENLISLCRFCHGQMHGSAKERIEWKERLSNLLN